jgi:hypothetical protein
MPYVAKQARDTDLVQCLVVLTFGGETRPKPLKLPVRIGKRKETLTLVCPALPCRVDVVPVRSADKVPRKRAELETLWSVEISPCSHLWHRITCGTVGIAQNPWL